MTAHEVLVAPTTPFARVEPAREVRGTLLASSMATLRETELEYRYYECLAPEYHQEIKAFVPLSWLAMQVAVGHYQAMDLVYPTPEVQIANGRRTAERTQNGYIRTIARGLSATGHLDPAELLKRVADATQRFVQGGGAVAAYRTGPKDARVELVGFPFLSIAYARYGWQGMFESTLSLAARRVFVRQDVRFERDDRVAFLIAWV